MYVDFWPTGNDRIQIIEYKDKLSFLNFKCPVNH